MRTSQFEKRRPFRPVAPRPRRLPDPAEYYSLRLERLSPPRQNGWALARCEFHKPDRNPSLSVNLESGAFHCFSCGATGGSIISFEARRAGVDYSQARRTLERD
ncbi:MAG: CHC2 zinc finger domain-containing protein [Nitrospinota bacterium]|nr:CHC2 zinc finger domain-containing protein [Nitrospinota bacterium]